MVLRPVYYPSSGEPPPTNMQYPQSGSPPPGQEEWQSGSRGQEYSGYPPNQDSPAYSAQSPPPHAAYGSPGGENAAYYSNSPAPMAYRPNWSEGQQNNYSSQQEYGNTPYQQSYQSPPQGPYGYEHPNANPYGQAPLAASGSAGYGSAGYGSPETRQEEGIPPLGVAPQTDEERGMMGALAGAAAGGYAGHKMHHGFLGTLGGAYAGHKLEDAYKDHKKHSKTPSPPPGPPPQHHMYPHAPHAYHATGHQMRGNFSASAVDITLDRDHDLIARCADVHGNRKLTSISLNDVLTNDDGHFKWVESGGNFAASARDIRLVDGGRVLEAELCSCNGSWRRDVVRLDERIENNDGDLRMV